MSVDAILSVVAMTGTFIVTLSVFVWWLSTKFFGLKGLIDRGFHVLKTELQDKIGDIKSDIEKRHNENVVRFHDVENRLSHLERGGRRGL